MTWVTNNLLCALTSVGCQINLMIIYNSVIVDSSRFYPSQKPVPQNLTFQVFIQMIFCHRAICTNVQQFFALCPCRTFGGNPQTRHHRWRPCVCAHVHRILYPDGPLRMEVLGDTCPPFWAEELWFRAYARISAHNMNCTWMWSFRHNLLYTPLSLYLRVLSTDSSTERLRCQNFLRHRPPPSRPRIYVHKGSRGHVGFFLRLVHRQNGRRTWPVEYPHPLESSLPAVTCHTSPPAVSCHIANGTCHCIFWHQTVAKIWYLFFGCWALSTAHMVCSKQWVRPEPGLKEPSKSEIKSQS